MIGRSLLLRGAALVLVVLCTAPTPGDVGGCGQRRQKLDEATFFSTKHAIECERCRECGLDSQRCNQACADDAAGRQFPEGCLPLVHDGEVCLRRLLDVDCETFASYVDERTNTVPSECNFCPEDAR